MMSSFRSAILFHSLILLLASLTGIHCVSAAEPQARILADKEFFTQGSFIAYAAPWSTEFGAGKAMRHGVDYRDEITVHPQTFPADVHIAWHWPLTPPKEVGVYGYHAVSYGSYDGGMPEEPIPARQVKDIKTLTETFRFSTARPIGDFNLLTEFFLTKTPGTEDKVAEVGFFLRTAKSAIEFAAVGEQLGTFTDPAGRKWKAATQPAPHGPYHMFIPEDAAEIPEGTIDFKAALDFLRAKKKLTGGEWFNGLAFGIEPITGSGSLQVESLSVRYE